MGYDLCVSGRGGVGGEYGTYCKCKDRVRNVLQMVF
jgi:hypothetical protein